MMKVVLDLLKEVAHREKSQACIKMITSQKIGHGTFDMCDKYRRGSSLYALALQLMDSLIRSQILICRQRDPIVCMGFSMRPLQIVPQVLISLHPYNRP